MEALRFWWVSRFHTEPGLARTPSKTKKSSHADKRLGSGGGKGLSGSTGCGMKGQQGKEPRK